MKEFNVIEIQEKIGYCFRNPDLLRQAFTRRSYAAENSGQDNEVLEFIGDKALDIAVIKVMMERFGTFTDDKSLKEFKVHNPRMFETKSPEGGYTDIKKNLVEGKALALIIEDLDLNQYLIMGNGDVLNNVQSQDKVKEDLFESILGAITLDCNWNLDIITDATKKLIDFDDYFKNGILNTTDYVSLVQQWLQRYYGGAVKMMPKYQYDFDEQRQEYHCSLDSSTCLCAGIFDGYGKSKRRAKMNTAELFYGYLCCKGVLQEENDAAIGGLDHKRATAQVNELVQKGLIKQPVYQFTRVGGKEGKLLWMCRMSNEEQTWKIVRQAITKKEAQRQCDDEYLICETDYWGE